MILHASHPKCLHDWQWHDIICFSTINQKILQYHIMIFYCGVERWHFTLGFDCCDILVLPGIFYNNFHPSVQFIKNFYHFHELG
jgi:hypothetical protein